MFIQLTITAKGLKTAEKELATATPNRVTTYCHEWHQEKTGHR